MVSVCRIRCWIPDKHSFGAKFKLFGVFCSIENQVIKKVCLWVDIGDNRSWNKYHCLIIINTIHVMIIGDISPRTFLTWEIIIFIQIEVYIWLSLIFLLDHTNIFSYSPLTGDEENWDNSKEYFDLRNVSFMRLHSLHSSTQNSCLIW